MRAVPDARYVVSVQGIVSVCARYFLAGMTTGEVLRSITPRDIVRMDTLFHGRRAFHRRGVIERECLTRTKHVIGRTSWDCAHVKAINPDASYHFCNETLRGTFYDSPKWSIAEARPHTVFVSQAAYPIKGLHQVLSAIALLRSEYPDVQLRIAGHDILRGRSLAGWLRRNGYGSHVAGMISRLALAPNVRFLGPLDESEMIAEYLRARVFVCPSSIENSPNSVGEAQILGVPTIAAYVGGIPDMIRDDTSGLLYRFEEVEMLAGHIRRIFSDDRLCDRLSAGAIRAAEQRHDVGINRAQTLRIYASVLGST
jgi:glycosyltransferase involved in cell wall biosynthesis